MDTMVLCEKCFRPFSDDITYNINYRRIFNAHFITVFLFVYVLQVLMVLFYANFRKLG